MDIVIENVKECPHCQGPVDRYCSNTPDPHVIYTTKYFQCGSIGDPLMAIMQAPSK
jgi:hypothetical protein